MNWMRKKTQKRMALILLSVLMVVTSFNFVLASNDSQFAAEADPRLPENQQERSYAQPVVEPQAITIEDSNATYTDKKEADDSALMQRQTVEAEQAPVLANETKERFVKAGVSGQELESLVQMAAKLQVEPEAVLDLLAQNDNDLIKTRKAMLQEKQYRVPDAMQKKYAEELELMTEAKLDDEARQRLVLLLELRPDLNFDDLLAAVREQGVALINEELKKTETMFAFDREQFVKYGLTEEDVAGISPFNLHLLLQLAEKDKSSLAELVRNFKQTLQSEGRSQ